MVLVEVREARGVLTGLQPAARCRDLIVSVRGDERDSIAGDNRRQRVLTDTETQSPTVGRQHAAFAESLEDEDPLP